MLSIRLVAASVSFMVTCCLVRLVTWNSEPFESTFPRLRQAQILARNGSLLQIKERQGRITPGYISSKNSKCFDVKVDWSTEVRPKYELDPTKFIIPTLVNGPNNQMMGLQQSILLSLLLNRTLVLPLFYHHEIDKFFRTIVPAKYRLNMQKLREYITVIPLQQALKRCDYRLDAIFAGRSFNIMSKGTSTLVRISMETGFRAVDFVDDFGKAEMEEIKRYLYSKGDVHIKEHFRNKRWWPANRSDDNWTNHVVKTDRHRQMPIFPKAAGSSDVSKIRSLYHTDAKCVLHWFPFREYPFKKSKDMDLDEIGNIDIHRFSRKESWKINADIIFKTTAPEAIIAWSKEFQNKHLYNSERDDYISMHWRFDDKDFFDYICKIESRKVFCDDVKRATNATAIAKAVLIQTANLDRFYKIKVGAVYIAAPDTLKHLIDEVVLALTDVKFVRKILPLKEPALKVFTSKQLKGFISRNYKDCEMAQPRQLSDTISQIEMDICTESYSFMWSRQSTWSANVKRRRFLEQKSSSVDHSVMDFVLLNMQDEEEDGPS